MIRLFVEIGLCFVVLFVASQIVIPILTKNEIFWLFRRSSNEALLKAESEKKKAEQELKAAQIRAETESIRLQTHLVELSTLDDDIEELEQDSISKKERTE